MQFKLKGIEWQIRLALRRVGSVKNDIIVEEIEDVYTYLEKYSKVDADTVKTKVGFDREHFNRKSE